LSLNGLGMYIKRKPYQNSYGCKELKKFLSRCFRGAEKMHLHYFHLAQRLIAYCC